MANSNGTASIYHQRDFRALEPWSVDGITLKAYAVVKADDDAISDDLVERAQSFVSGFLKADAERAGAAHELGYVILHAGDAGVWLLTHWWAHEDICMARLSFAKSRSDDFEKLIDPPFHACVWEQVVIAHERDAWVRTVMAGRSTRHYLGDRLADGRY